ncbi:MAG: DUF927 domain-containing protein [Brockia lithotrophica]|nr:DUF927 domain-containing protein [Brockia lithotrophica]
MGRENFGLPEVQKFIFHLLETYSADEIRALQYYLADRYEEYAKHLPKDLLFEKRSPGILNIPPEELGNILQDYDPKGYLPLLKEEEKAWKEIKQKYRSILENAEKDKLVKKKRKEVDDIPTIFDFIPSEEPQSSSTIESEETSARWEETSSLRSEETSSLRSEEEKIRFVQEEPNEGGIAVFVDNSLVERIAERFPEELKKQKRWVLWRKEKYGERATKVPYQVTNKRADSTDPSTWQSFDAVSGAYYASLETNNPFSGIGIVLGKVQPEDALCLWGLDIDWKERNTSEREIPEEVKPVLEIINSYTEFSPSGKGLHVLFYTDFDANLSKNRISKNEIGYEIYKEKRFFTVTGDTLNDARIRAISEDELYAVIKYIFKGDIKEEQIFASSENKDVLKDPREMVEPAGAFNRVYNIHEAIEKFLSGVYVYEKGRYTYLHGTSALGGVVLDGGLRFYSHHSTDPAGGRICSAFDLVRIHKFGHLDKGIDTENTPYLRIPSVREMMRFALQDENVRKELEKDTIAKVTAEAIVALEPFEEKIAEDPETVYSDFLIMLKIYNPSLYAHYMKRYRELPPVLKRNHDPNKVEEMHEMQAREILSQIEGIGSDPDIVREIQNRYGIDVLQLQTKIEEYVLKPEGIVVYKKDMENYITRSPILITERYETLDGEAFVEVAWRMKEKDRYVWNEIVESLGTFGSKREIEKLSKMRFPVHNKNSSDISKYVISFYHLNLEHIPKKTLSKHAGWLDPGRFFILGDRAIVDGAEIPLDDAQVRIKTDGSVEQTIEALHKHGNVEKWLDMVWKVKDYPKAMIALHASFAAPLVEILGAPNFVLDIAGRTTVGKTTTLKLATSVWGDPKDGAKSLLKTWDTTRVWRERMFGALRGIPAILDETMRAKSKDEVAQTVYDFVSGSGRGRGSIVGTQEMSDFRGVLLSTGEQSILAYAGGDRGGVWARVVSLKGSPFGGENAEIAHLIREVVHEHYGHAGGILLKYITRHPEKHAEWRDMYNDIVREMAKKTDSIRGRLHQALAAIEITQIIAAEAFEEEGFDFPVVELFTPEIEADIEDQAKMAPPENRALGDVVSFVLANEQKFLTDSGDTEKEPSGGWIGKILPDGSVAFYPHQIRRILEDFGYEPQAILDAWADKGVLEKDKSGRKNQKNIWMNGKVSKAYVIRGEVFKELEKDEAV